MLLDPVLLALLQQYTLDALTSFVEQNRDDDMVLIVLGDHWPVPTVSGDTVGHDVPVSIIARDPAVLDKVAGWGWQQGWQQPMAAKPGVIPLRPLGVGDILDGAVTTMRGEPSLCSLNNFVSRFSAPPTISAGRMLIHSQLASSRTERARCTWASPSRASGSRRRI